MLTTDQLEDLEKTLWATTGNPEAYKLLRDNRELRIECKTLMTLVYRVLSNNYGSLEQNEKLWELETKLTDMGEILE